MKMETIGYYRWMVCFVVTVIFCAASACRVFAANGGWKDVSSGIDKTVSITCVRGIPGTDTLYAGTSDGLYRTRDQGKTWVRVDLPDERAYVTRIAFSSGKIFVSSRNGLYEKNIDGWKWIPGKCGLAGAAAEGYDKPGPVMAWTNNEVFLFENDTYRRVGPQTSWDVIDDAAIKDGYVYVASRGKLYYSSNTDDTWGRQFIAAGSGNEIIDDVSEDEEGAVPYPIIRRIDPTAPEGVTVTTGEGIFLLHEGEFSAPRIDTAGLPAQEVIFALNTGEKIFAATGRKVFVHDLAEPAGGWKTVFEKYAMGNIMCLELTRDAAENARLWVATENGVYAKDIRDMSGAVEDLRLNRNDMGGIGNYPTILEVQRMAIEYAEVSPEKIKRWRTGAKWKAVMPRVSLSFSESNDENIELYKSATKYYVARGPNETGNDWSIGLTWDLADVVWNPSQTSIDVRSKLMVQLRGDILEEVTRLYFERKRLLAGIGVDMAQGEDRSPEKTNEKLIRVNELTAYIDAFTGGRFSTAMGRKGPS
ncbi:MAG: hypothetical protein KKG95_06165 [Candidatus Omnitrophica bacterium]|nr:hypothetical protein [Candidatus Omnitrophota bacterium]MBU1784906.1 hypothetical protein [Candidatus Omnitrophota bacterium]